MKALSDLLALGEGTTVEFKRSPRSDLGREICAFANATGGVILLGVDDEGTVLGVEGHNRLKSQVQSVARSADPPISVELESMGDVLAVRVPSQRGKPYSFGGKFFVRDGASSQQMSRDEIREFFFAEGVIRFDESPCRRFSLNDDLDDETWAVFRRGRRSPITWTPIPHFGISNCWPPTAG
ncbi:MAG: ATP-binding protein [Gemmatimonadota bacterium]|nr:ATP-binding protein [bacterium]MDE2873858.1 ATP-binding protein [Gemmatimonadota bacterium]